jgi:hypothetical protein
LLPQCRGRQLRSLEQPRGAKIIHFRSDFLVPPFLLRIILVEDKGPHHFFDLGEIRTAQIVRGKSVWGEEGEFAGEFLWQQPRF